MTCDWCGHDHEQADLCAKRPTWGRRGFLALMGAGIAGLALPGPAPPPYAYDRALLLKQLNIWGGPIPWIGSMTGLKYDTNIEDYSFLEYNPQT